MTAPHDLDRQLDAFLRDGPIELPDPSFDAVRDRIEATGQRVVIGPWRMPDMNKLLAIGLGGAAVVVALVLGAQLLGPAAPGGVGAPAQSATPSSGLPSSGLPSPSAWAGLPRGPFVVTAPGGPVQITLDIASPGWSAMPDFEALSKDDDGKDAPHTVGAALLAWGWPAGTGFNVFGDPCHWQSTIPETPATTPDGIVAAFAAQAASDPTAPVDVTIGGYTGKSITLTVPMAYDKPGASREERFADCDNDVYAFYGIEGEAGDARNAQGAGQVDELWILDVGGSIVILDATYSPATPTELVDEMRAMAASATFE